jgi:hypothetical protein
MIARQRLAWYLSALGVLALVVIHRHPMIHRAFSAMEIALDPGTYMDFSSAFRSMTASVLVLFVVAYAMIWACSSTLPTRGSAPQEACGERSSDQGGHFEMAAGPGFIRS